MKTARAALSGDSQAAFEKAEQKICNESEDCGRNCAGEDNGVTHHGHTTKDKCAEAAGSNRGSDGGNADGDDGSGANAGHDEAAGERQANTKENLPLGHAHAFGGFENGGIDRGKTDKGVAQNGQESVENERHNGGVRSDAAEEG